MRSRTKDKGNEEAGEAVGEEVVGVEERTCIGELALERTKTSSKNKPDLSREAKNIKESLPLLPRSTLCHDFHQFFPFLSFSF